MEKFAGYGFNKSHAAAYALIAYQTAWIKTNYVHEFFVSMMTLENNNTEKLSSFETSTIDDTVLLTVLKTQQQVIADFKEIMSGEEPVAYLFKEPHVVDFNQFSFSKEENKFQSSESTAHKEEKTSYEDDLPF